MGTGTRLGGFLAVAALVGAGCASGGATGGPSESGSASLSATQSASATVPALASASSQPTPSGLAGLQLIVMADSVQGGVGLWRFQSPDKWTAIGPTVGATALGSSADGPLLAGKLKIESRTWTDPSKALGSVALKWPTAIPTDPVVAADKSPDGQWALITSDGTSAAYFTADTDGTVSVLSPAPAQTLTPLIAWLDSTHLIALNTDVEQVSRFAVLDTATNGAKSIETFGGIRYFALSGDRKTIAVATEDAVYIASVTDWLAGVQPQKVAAVEASHVVWALALNREGSALALLSGSASADGHVSDVHEVVYARSGAAWSKTVDSAVPFTTAMSQVWMA